MRERRAEKAAASQKQLVRKQSVAAGAVASNQAEFQQKFGDASKTAEEAARSASPAAPVKASAAVAPVAAASTEPADVSDPTEAEAPRVSAGERRESEAQETAMDRARKAAAAKLGKDVKSGGGSLAAHKAEVEDTPMTAADRAKAVSYTHLTLPTICSV